MSDKTGIEWTDATWNPVTGCSKVSQGCKHCYAEREWPRMTKLVPAYAGRDFTDVRCHPERLDQPLRWKKPRKVFVNSMSDLFHEAIPEDFILSVFVTMAAARQHTFQVLTKRPDRMRDLLTRWRNSGLVLREGCGVNLRNVWLGVSVEDQATADERIPLLRATPAAVRWISAEPLLGRVDLCETFGMWWNQTMNCFESSSSSGFNRNPNNQRETAIDWVVVGGESGPKARPMHPAWARSLRDQCAAAGVPFLFKQWGEWIGADQEECPIGPPASRWMWGDGTPFKYGDGQSGHLPLLCRAGKKVAGRNRDGVKHDGYPQQGDK